LPSILAPHNYEVIAVPDYGCLHLNPPLPYLGRITLLANRGMV